jgi:hypothetical protein
MIEPTCRCPGCGECKAASCSRYLYAWANSRIRYCRAQEAKLDYPGCSYIPILLVEAAQERRTLEAVLRILAGDPTP